jgi:hypothetical protein
LSFNPKQELDVTALHIKLHDTGGNKTKTPGPGAQSALRALARSVALLSNPIVLSFSFGAGDAVAWLFPGRLISCWNIFLVFGDGSLYQV